MRISRRSFLAGSAAAVAGSAAAYAVDSRSSGATSLALASASGRLGDVVGKITVGYQGWFACIGDRSPIGLWWHWAQNESLPPSPANENLKAWPDMREYGRWYHTDYANLRNGNRADLFSSYDQTTVNAHFRWMQQHGCDTAALQRFNPTGGEGPIRNAITARVRTAAEAYGRKFYIMYDVSGWLPAADMPSQIKRDWTEKMAAYTASPAYARQDGKPVVCIWGFGFNDDNHPFTAAQCQETIDWFKKQGVYLIGGVPREWRLGTGGSRAGYLGVYRSFNALSPWMVGAIGDAAGSDWMHANFTVPDEADCRAHGVDYQPCVLPGDVSSGTQRAHGDFMWRQFYNMTRAKVQGIYISMFDEFGEGNQICKTADTQASVPAGSGLRTLDQDGTVCSSDYYLRLTSDGGRMFKGDVKLTATRPTRPFILGASMGMTLSLRARNHKIVAAVTKGTPNLVAGGAAIGPWGQFGLLDAGNGNIALRVRASGKIVTVAGNAAPLVASGTRVGKAQTFEIIHNANGTISLLAEANKRYVSARSTGTPALAANSATIGPWEQFTLITDN